MCDLKIIAVIGDVTLVYKREIEKLLYSCYSICKLSFTFCVLIISQKKSCHYMMKEESKVLSNTDSTRNLYANTSFAVYTNLHILSTQSYINGS